ncbi:MAG: hypothetical protein H7839_00345 [Magnetococcus sp. YQC-5]
MSFIILRQLFADTESLRDYLKGVTPGFDDIHRRLHLAERTINHQRPDHFYKYHLQHALKQKNNDINELLLATFNSVTQEYLEIFGNRVSVVPKKMDPWQGILTRIPALPLVCFVLHDRFGAPALDKLKILDYMESYVIPNLFPTTLPSPHIPHLERHIREKKLMELHMHLNGTTEPDQVWLHALENSNQFYQELKATLKKQLVKEQFDQIEPGIQPSDFHDRLRLAARLREAMILFIYQGVPFLDQQFDQMRDLTSLPFFQSDILIPGCHPLSRMDSAFESLPGTVLEGIFHIHVFRYILGQQNKTLIRAYHLYLLLWGFFNRFLVQQEEQFGFDQFEKFANNEMRSSSEKTYAQRFSQLSGKNGNDINYVEGRFSPKETFDGNVKLLTDILTGYAQFQGITGRISLFNTTSIPNPKAMDLRLVAHFIKTDEPAKKMGSGVRHQALRTKLETTARSLLTLWDESSLLRKHMTGIDAANNERYAGPEVFAPVYRRFRRHGFEHFTFHVGEDFVHLISGMRAIYEAMEFLPLKRGNRIGHGTAVGIKPELWIETMQPTIMVPKQEWLDNLLFIQFLFSEEHNGEPEAPLSIRDDIERLTREIYTPNPLSSTLDNNNNSLPLPSTLLDAWKMRQLDPLIACYPFRQKMDFLDINEYDEYDNDNNEYDKYKGHNEWQLIKKAKKKKDAFDLYLKYHQKEYAERGEKMLAVDLNDQRFSPAILRRMQTIMLKKLHQKEIVIESMPTSNVRISFYRSHKDHHLWRWLGLDNTEENNFLPPICLATDDPGIFATNLRNEYAHVYEWLTKIFGLSPSQAMVHIEQLSINSATYRFIDSPVTTPPEKIKKI